MSSEGKLLGSKHENDIEDGKENSNEASMEHEETGTEWELSHKNVVALLNYNLFIINSLQQLCSIL